MKKIYILITFLFFADYLFAQTDSTGSIKTIAASYNHIPLSNATIILLSAKDRRL